jgi:hypothetical protein
MAVFLICYGVLWRIATAFFRFCKPLMIYGFFFFGPAFKRDVPLDTQKGNKKSQGIPILHRDCLPSPPPVPQRICLFFVFLRDGVSPLTYILSCCYLLCFYSP